jgi:hypothetical protein
LPQRLQRLLGGVFLFQTETAFAFGLGLLGLSWLLPNHYSPWLSFHSEAIAFAAIAALMAGVLISSVSPKILMPSLVPGLLAIAALPWLQWICGLSFFAGDAWLVSYFLIGWALAIFLGYHFTQDGADKCLLGLMHMLWVAALLSAMIGLVQWLKLEPDLGIYVWQTDLDSPALGNMGQPNQLSTLLLMGLVAYGYVYERGLIGRFTLVIGVLFMTWVLVLAHSRAGMLGVLAIGGALWVKHSRIRSHLSKPLIIGWMITFGLATIASPYIDRALLLEAGHEVLFSSGGRGLIWMQILEGIAHAPWAGYGWNQTATAQLAGVEPHVGSMYVSYAHNALLDILAWNGVPLGLMLIGLGGYWFFTRFFRVSGLTGTYAMVALLPFVAHSMVEFPFAYAYFLLSAGLLMGVVEASLGVSEGWLISRFWAGCALAGWIAIGGIMVREYFLIEEDYRVARFESFRVGVTEATYETPKLWIFTQMDSMLKATRQQALPCMTAQQLEDLGRTALRFPQGGIIFRYALALALNGNPAAAVHWMSVLRGLFGDDFYQRAKVAWVEQAEKYPELNSIRLP